ncbi:MAG: 1-acyl-sn-glycerol-3-phosphate acyltransferase [Bacteroidales bacterium]|nr:1-acyl-sn-glycerol-3-phosphate acyltransferase [Bacteroidales bacterium]
MRWFSKLIFFLLGWKINGQFPTLKKSVVILASHTGNFDAVLGKIFINIVGVKYNVLAKKELFKFPWNIVMRLLHALPVDRKNKHVSVTQQVKSVLDRHENMHILLSPEGTRKRVTRWRKGFYHIAHEAGIPIVVVGLDFKLKEMQIKGVIDSSQDLLTVMKQVNAHYEGINAKYPERFALDSLEDIVEEEYKVA